MRRIVVISDLQVPLHHKRNVKTFQRFIRDIQPDELASVGDEVDFPQVSRWNKSMAGEYEGTLQAHIDEGRAVLGAFRDAVGDKPFHVMRSNHMDRPLVYLRKYAPALSSLRSLTVESLLDFDGLGITYHTRPYLLAPNTLLMHGDEGGLSQKAGETARKLADRTARSVVCGHTHRQGYIPYTHSAAYAAHGGTFGVEAGHLMDLRSAGYIGGGIANWQTGFAVLYVEGRNVTPVVVPIQRDGSFTFEGRTWTP